MAAHTQCRAGQSARGHGARPAGGAPGHARRVPAGGLATCRGRGRHRVGDGAASAGQDRHGRRRESGREGAATVAPSNEKRFVFWVVFGCQKSLD